MSDQSIQANHPIDLDQPLIARMLSGLHVQERERALQELLEGSHSATRVFSDDQVEFLAPRIAKALATATARQAVSFLVTTPRPRSSPLESAITETTSGSLHADGASLYVTLSQYRYAPSPPSLNFATDSRVRDTSGLSNRRLLFMPSAAQRPDGFYRPTGGASTDRFLAIDYRLLQHNGMAGAVTERPVPSAERSVASTRELPATTPVSDIGSQTAETLAQHEAEIHALKDLVIKKDLELESLRKELESVRKQLDNQKRKPALPPKSQQTIP